MTIEKLISDLTIAVNGLTSAIAQQGIAANLGVSNVPQTPVSVSALPQTGAVMGGTSLGNMPAAQQQMPAPPTFAAPQQPQFTMPAAAPAAPFSDNAGLIAYVMDAYKTMGPQKGANIQGVLGGIGVQNINDVKPEQYGAVYQGVEALKRG